jgi:hypothetical protein
MSELRDAGRVAADVFDRFVAPGGSAAGDNHQVTAPAASSSARWVLMQHVEVCHRKADLLEAQAASSAEPSRARLSDVAQCLRALADALARLDAGATATPGGAR